MRTNVHTSFEQELLHNEKLRIGVLLTIFVAGLAYPLTNYLTLDSDAVPELHQTLKTSIFFLLSMIGYELIAMIFVIRRIEKSALQLSKWRQYLNAAIEISTPAILMLLLSRIVVSPVYVMNFPVVNLYFIFITLSTLRLDYRISMFTAAVGAMEYYLFGIYADQLSAGDQLHGVEHSLLAIGAKAVGILMAGMGASFVSHQLRKRIHRSLDGAVKESRIINLFGQQVSREVVEEMMSSDFQVPSKLMRVCIMFIDIRNFTKTVNSKTPAEIVEYQNLFFSIVIEAVTRHGGIINQFLGDGCMVTFGAPVALDNLCHRAVASALEIKRALIEQAAAHQIPDTAIGVGIHVGEAVTGNIGTSIRQQYSITGSVVILAARIEQLNKEFKSEILMSADVMREVEDFMHGPESMGNVSLKGWHEPVGIYKIA